MIEKVKDDFAELLQPSTQYLVKKRCRADFLTMVGFALNLVAAVLFALDCFRWAGLMVLLAGLFDFLDGQVARAGKTATTFGALLDSTVDRYSEIVVWFGMAVSFIRSGSLWTSSAQVILSGRRRSRCPASLLEARACEFSMRQLDGSSPSPLPGTISSRRDAAGASTP